jgi:twitching motility protein PilT
MQIFSNKKTDKNGSRTKELMGESLVKHNLITKDQLQKALRRRAQVDLPLGSILIDMGFIAIDDFLEFLSQKYEIPAINLFKTDIDQKILDLVPLEKMKQYKVIPVSVEGNTLKLAMISPQDFMTISDLEFTIGKKIKPLIAPFFMMEAALHLLSDSYKDGLKGKDIEKSAMHDKAEPRIAGKIGKLLSYFIDSGASDMLLTAGAPPTLKFSSEIKRISSISLTPADCEEYTKELLPQEHWEKFLLQKELDTSLTYPDMGRFRMNFYHQRNSISISIRHIKDKLPTLKELSLPDWLADFALKPEGLILISGPAGHGKSTTMNALVDIINSNRRSNIITLEDPIEYLHKHKKSNVNQREIGRDTATFESGLRSIFRQAANVIVIGELRDKESFEIALRAARTGHLVLSTMNAASSTAVIRIIINMFPAHQQNMIQLMVADSLMLSLNQRLVRRRDGTGVVVALERFINSYRVSNFIREGKVHQIQSLMQAGTEEFSSLESSLADLFKSGTIDFDDGLIFSANHQLYRELTGVKA